MVAAAAAVSLLTAVGVGLLYSSLGIIVVALLTLIIAVLFYRSWTVKHFGGVTGDLCGAFIEGMEVLLWLVLIVYLSFGI